MREIIEEFFYGKYEFNYKISIFEELLPYLTEMQIDENNNLILSLSMDDIELFELEEQEKNFFVNYVKSIGIVIIDSKGDEIIHGDDEYHVYRLDKNNTLPVLLKNKETEKLFKLYKETNDDSIREKIIIGNMRVVTYLSWFYSKTFSIDIEEIEQYGYEGLLHAVDHYDNTGGNTFYNYAKIYIKRFIYKGLYEQLGIGFSVNLTPSFLYKKTQLEKLNGISIGDDALLIEEIADFLIAEQLIGYNSRDLLIRGIELMCNKCSLEELLDDNEELFICEQESNFNEIDKEAIRKLLANVPVRNQKVLMLYYGLYDGIVHTLEEIGEQMNVSRQCAYRYLKSALKTIEKSSDYERLKMFYDEDIFSPDEKQPYIKIK